MSYLPINLLNVLYISIDFFLSQKHISIMDRLRKLFRRIRRKDREVKEEKEEKVVTDTLYPKLNVQTRLYPDLSGFYCAYPDVADNYWRYLYLVECYR